MEPRWPPREPKGEVSAWDSSDAMRLKYVLPREAGRERKPTEALGLRGEETKPAELERCWRPNDWSLESGERRGDSKVDVRGVRG